MAKTVQEARRRQRVLCSEDLYSWWDGSEGVTYWLIGKSGVSFCPRRCDYPNIGMSWGLLAWILFFFNRCSSTVVSIFLLPLPPPKPSPLPTLNPTRLWLCPCVLHTCSLTTLSPNPPNTPSYLPSGYCQFVLNFLILLQTLFVHFIYVMRGRLLTKVVLWAFLWAL